MRADNLSSQVRADWVSRFSSAACFQLDYFDSFSSLGTVPRLIFCLCSEL